MIHKACMPVYMNSGKIVADGTGGTGGKIEGSTRGPRGPKNVLNFSALNPQYKNHLDFSILEASL